MPSVATTKGNINQQHQNIKSTTFKMSIPTESDYKLEFMKTTGIHINKVYAPLVEMDEYDCNCRAPQIVHKTCNNPGIQHRPLLAHQSHPNTAPALPDSSKPS